MKNGPKSNTQFHGIMTIGLTLAEASNRYRLLAMGKGATAKVDAGNNLAFVTTAGDGMPEMFNPLTGEMDLRTSKSFLDKLSFEAKASGDVTTNHYECTAGCAQHIVYDSEQLLKFCPVCTTAVTAGDDGEPDNWSDVEDAEDDEDDAEDGEGEDDAEDDGDEEDAEDDDDADADDDSVIASDADDAEDDEEDEEDLDLDDEEDDDEEDDAAEASATPEPLVVAADSKADAIRIIKEQYAGSAQASADVDYMVCSSDTCGAHVMSEQEGLSACPSCNSALVEPSVPGSEGIVRVPAPAPALASDEDDDEDDDLSVVDDEDDEDEDDDESECSATDSATHGLLPRTTKTRTVAEAMEQIDVDMLERIDDQAEDAHRALDVSFSAAIASAPQWTAFFNGQPVATALEADAGDNKSIFTNASFGHAVVAGAKHVGVKKVLREMGFRPIVCQVSVPAVINEKVAAGVATASAALETDKAAFTERFMSALATAAIGINRGFFTDVKNPVKSALWNALSSAGVKNAEVLLDNAFRASSDEYHRVLFAQASDIVSKPEEVQTSLAKAVLGTAYMAVTASDAPSQGELVERLGNFGTAVASSVTHGHQEYVASPAVASASTDERVSSVVASLGRRR